MTRARSTAGVSDHFGRASAAALTAASASAAVLKGTRAITLPVDGLKHSPRRDDLLGCQLPPTRFAKVFTSDDTAVACMEDSFWQRPTIIAWFAGECAGRRSGGVVCGGLSRGSQLPEVTLNPHRPTRKVPRTHDLPRIGR